LALEVARGKDYQRRQDKVWQKDRQGGEVCMISLVEFNRQMEEWFDDWWSRSAPMSATKQSFELMADLTAEAAYNIIEASITDDGK
jgi:hypothetical protein